MNKKLYLAIAITSIIFTQNTQPIFASKFPKKITKKKLLKKQKKADAYFNFVSDQSIISLSYKADKTSVTCKLYKDPATFLSQEEQKKFTKSVAYIDKKPVEVWTLHYGDLPDGVFPIEKNEAKPNSDDYWKSYLFAQKRRIFEEKQNPQSMSLQNLQNYLLNKKTVFYTGAGISIAGGVWGMDMLLKKMKLKEFKKDPKKFIKILIHNKKEMCQNFKTFCKSMFFNSATDAHYALASIAKKINALILTENLDYLHEQSGIKPHRLHNVKKSKKKFPYSFLRKIDAIVCIGLSYDDKAFLAWYKENNPDGKIISIDIKQPSYLGEEDFLVQGDLQKILVAIEKEFHEK